MIPADLVFSHHYLVAPYHTSWDPVLSDHNTCHYSRKDTGKTARALADLCAKAGDGALFDTADHPMRGLLVKDVKK